MTSRDLRIAVVGLGYVGLPLAVRFGLAGVKVIGFDTDSKKVAELRQGYERMGEVSTDDLSNSGLILTDDPKLLGQATFVIIAVPTPITSAKQPDLGAVEAASCTVGRHLR